jgi:hypothetical protein
MYRAVCISFNREHFKVKGKVVDRDLVFSGEVLLSAGQESLCKEEARQPKDRWGAVVNPLLQKLDALHGPGL